MNNTTETPTEIIEPKRRGRLATFFIRLVREKPLGIACGIIILFLILVAIFAEALSLSLYENKPDRQDAGLISPASAGYRLRGVRLIEPPDPRGSSFDNGRSGSDHS